MSQGRMNNMRSINILVIDDETTFVNRLMESLKRKDTKDRIGKVVVDSSMLGDKSLEQYDASIHNTKFDIVLIDYQLGCSYTGILVSAWMMLQLQVPRMTLTSGAYPGPRDYFDGYITKDEIIDSPNEVIDRIVSCVETFNYNKWLEKQYDQLVDQYSKMLSDDQDLRLNPCEKENLASLANLLDKFEKIIDEEQEKAIKLKMEYINNQVGFAEKEKVYNQELYEKQKQLQETLKELKKYHE